LGLPKREPEIVHLIQQLARVEEDVLERLGVDIGNVSPGPSASFQGEVRESDRDDFEYFDEFGAGWKMPKDGGMYFDLFHLPLSGEITAMDVDAHSLPDPLD
jgi:uroporphyrinogen decarboxylase